MIPVKPTAAARPVHSMGRSNLATVYTDAAAAVESEACHGGRAVWGFLRSRVFAASGTDSAQTPAQPSRRD